MVYSHSQAAFQFSLNKLDWNRIVAMLVWVLLLVGVASAQSAHDDNVVVVQGTYDGTVFGVGKSVRIAGTVKQGAMSFGGDVIVEGTVDGDVAAIGGSVIQKAGSRIGGDVIVLGGSYHADDAPANRRPEAMTMMYAGYQQELRDMMRDPTGIFSPHWTPTYFGIRLLVVLFWFLVALGFTAAMPGSMHAARRSPPSLGRNCTKPMPTRSSSSATASAPCPPSRRSPISRAKILSFWKNSRSRCSPSAHAS